MRSATFVYLSAVLCLCGATLVVHAESAPQSCSLKIIAKEVVATAAQREAAGDIAQPPLTDQADGFAWPDTPLGVIKTDEGYAFFGSDGALHSKQIWHGHRYGNDKYGSITRTLGTLDNPLGTAPPIDVTILPNPDPAINPYYQSYDYMGGGPLYKVPQGLPGAGQSADSSTTPRFRRSPRKAFIRCWDWRPRPIKA